MTLQVPGTINQAVGAVTGFTAPVFTTVASSTTVPNGKTAVVTAKGGTQPVGVDVHSASRNFSFLSVRPASIKSLPSLNAAGQLVNVPINVYSLSTRKGLTSLSGQPPQHGYVKSQIGIPAGADTGDPDNIAAMILAHTMCLAQLAQEIVNTAKTGEI
jgi:hypothetical protein